jgi:hypothetical protein
MSVLTSSTFPPPLPMPPPPPPPPPPPRPPHSSQQQPPDPTQLVQDVAAGAKPRFNNDIEELDWLIANVWGPPKPLKTSWKRGECPEFDAMCAAYDKEMEALRKKVEAELHAKWEKQDKERALYM